MCFFFVLILWTQVVPFQNNNVKLIRVFLTRLVFPDTEYKVNKKNVDVGQVSVILFKEPLILSLFTIVQLVRKIMLLLYRKNCT